MTTHTPSQLPSIEWKPCIYCSEISPVGCIYCSGTGTEPVEMENPVIKKECGFHYKDHYHDYKYQVGVEFEVWEDLPRITNFRETGEAKYCKKFFPLRPKVEGDNSILMVVPQCDLENYNEKILQG